MKTLTDFLRVLSEANCAMNVQDGMVWFEDGTHYPVKDWPDALANVLTMVDDLDEYLREIRAENLDGSEPVLGELLEKSLTLRLEMAA